MSPANTMPDFNSATLIMLMISSEFFCSGIKKIRDQCQIVQLNLSANSAKFFRILVFNRRRIESEETGMNRVGPKWSRLENNDRDAGKS